MRVQSVKIWVFLWLGLAACPDPQPAPPSTEGAAQACERFQALDCRDVEGRGLWEPTPGGIACVEVFEVAAEQGIDLAPACLATIERCEDRDKCTSAAGK